MPQIFRVGSYWVYFWSNEGIPPEPVHVHITERRPVPNATKVWGSRAGRIFDEFTPAFRRAADVLHAKITELGAAAD